MTCGTIKKSHRKIKKMLDKRARVCYNKIGAFLPSRGRGAGYNMVTIFYRK